MASRASLRFGKNHNSIGRKICEVFAAENSPVDANEMKSIQKTTGRNAKSAGDGSGVVR